MRKLTGMILSTAVLVSSVSFGVANAAETAKPATVAMKQDSKEPQKTATTVNEKAVDSKQMKVAENTQAVAKPAVSTTKEAPKTEAKTASKVTTKAEAKPGVAEQKPATTSTQVKQPS